jgi:acetyltransferase-like isoleucine patch superfamily enzyme
MNPLINIVFAVKRAYFRARYPGLTLGKGVQIRGRIKLRRGIKVTIGDRTRINKRARFAGPGTVTVGADCLLNESWIGCWTSVTIGDRCLISNCEIMDNDFHNLDPATRHHPAVPATRAPIVIGENVWIGSDALILKGVHIGSGSVVGAACVVRADVPENVVVTGNPQIIVKRFDV